MTGTVSVRKAGIWAVGLCLGVAAAAAAQPVPTTSTPAAPQPLGLVIQPGLDLPLNTNVPALGGGQSQGVQLAGSTRLQLTVRYSPRETWFVRVTGYVYLDRDRQQPWNPDFTYSFGYDNWRPGTLALTYDNYGGNRVNPDAARGEQVTRFDEGTVTASYKIPMPGALESLLAPDGEARWTASIGAHLTPRFRRLNDDTRGSWKRSLSVGMRSRFYRRLYVEGRAFWYPTPEQQQPWDPDFTYGVGWFDWRSRTLSVQYGNYSGNRWPGRARAGTGAFRNASITVFYTTAW